MLVHASASSICGECPDFSKTTSSESGINSAIVSLHDTGVIQSVRPDGDECRRLDAGELRLQVVVRQVHRERVVVRLISVRRRLRPCARRRRGRRRSRRGAGSRASSRAGRRCRAPAVVDPVELLHVDHHAVAGERVRRARGARCRCRREVSRSTTAANAFRVAGRVLHRHEAAVRSARHDDRSAPIHSRRASMSAAHCSWLNVAVALALAASRARRRRRRGTRRRAGRSSPAARRATRAPARRGA